MHTKIWESCVELIAELLDMGMFNILGYLQTASKLLLLSYILAVYEGSSCAIHLLTLQNNNLTF